jgi:hypothetical protein
VNKTKGQQQTGIEVANDVPAIPAKAGTSYINLHCLFNLSKGTNNRK